jgi:hypothetical protein
MIDTFCGAKLFPEVLIWWLATFAAVSLPASIAWRKEGVTVGALLGAGNRSATNPASYFRADRVRAITVINLIGVGGWMVGVLTLVAGTVVCGP